jgi:hypothetical protein
MVRNIIVALMIVFGFAVSCSGPPEVASPPECEADGYLKALAPCVVSCVVDPATHAFGTCDDPKGQALCITYSMGEVVPVVKFNGAPSAQVFIDTECE